MSKIWERYETSNVVPYKAYSTIRMMISALFLGLGIVHCATLKDHRRYISGIASLKYNS